MKILLTINGLIELAAGLAFLFWPGIVQHLPGLSEIDDSAGVRMLLSMYGTAAVVLGIYSFVLLRHTHRGSLMIGSLFLFALFHTGISTNQFLVNPDLRPAIVHALLAIAFWWTYWNRR